MTLYVKPISALLVRDTEIFSNMDPYIVAIVGVDKKRSRTIKQGGKKPKWQNQVFVFKPTANSMLVTVYDEDMVSDDVVGSANIDLKKYINNPVQHQQNIELTYKGRKSGTLKMSIKYQPQNSSTWGNSQQNNNSGWGSQGNNQGEWGNQNQQNYNQGAWNAFPQNNSQNWGNQYNNQQNYSGWGNQLNNGNQLQPVYSVQPQSQNYWQNNQQPQVNNIPNNAPNPLNPLNTVGQVLKLAQMSESLSRSQQQNQPNRNPGTSNGWGPNNNGWGNQGGW